MPAPAARMSIRSEKRIRTCRSIRRCARVIHLRLGPGCEGLRWQLKILDGHITGRDWFALDRFTIADIALGSIVQRCLEFPIERPPYPELSHWQAAIDARPAFAVTIGTKPSALSPAA
jgi:glutathione S-transferase